MIYQYCRYCTDIYRVYILYTVRYPVQTKYLFNSLEISDILRKIIYQEVLFNGFIIDCRIHFFGFRSVSPITLVVICRVCWCFSYYSGGDMQGLLVFLLLYSGGDMQGLLVFLLLLWWRYAGSAGVSPITLMGIRRVCQCFSYYSGGDMQGLLVFLILLWW